MSAAGNDKLSAGPVLAVRGLKAYYRTSHFNVNREVKAVDGVDFEVQRNEIYGLAGESSSGKTTLIKTIAAALKPPLEIVAGRVDFSFAPDILRMKAEALDALRWRHLSLEQRCNSESLYGLLLIPSTYRLLMRQGCADVGLCLKTIGAMSLTYANEPVKLRFVVGTI